MIVAEGTQQHGDQGYRVVGCSREMLGVAVLHSVQGVQKWRLSVRLGDRRWVLHVAALWNTAEERSGVGRRGGALRHCRIVG